MLTYAEQATQDSLAGINRVLTWMFVLEMLAKLVGLGPSEFFTGPEAGFNCFDCVVTLASLCEEINVTVFPDSSSTTGMSVLRGVRLMRVLKLMSVPVTQ
jgi:hypothetical protein